MITVQAFTFNPVQENTYILYNEKGECCIIDPGCYFPAEEAALTDFIAQNELKPILLLNTHCHFDHIFGNKLVHQTFGLTLHLHQLEKQVLDLGPVSTQKWGILWDKWYDGELKFIEEGVAIKFGDDDLQVLFTPGHSPGSICFYSQENKFVIAGDVLFNGSVGRTDLPGGDFTILKESILTKLYTLPEDVIVYSGHGESTTIGDEMRNNPFVKMV
jgi:glyoxylase-like metal-dependent hydrolase (beta-lactamase superfamily II)